MDHQDHGELLFKRDVVRHLDFVSDRRTSVSVSTFHSDKFVVISETGNVDMPEKIGKRGTTSRLF